jgi:hypothetical protein
MVEKSSSSWVKEDLAEEPDTQLYRSLHNSFWMHIDESGDVPEEFLSIKGEYKGDGSYNTDISLDWSKYCEPAVSLIRKFILRCCRKRSLEIKEIIDFLNIHPTHNVNEDELSANDLNINDRVISTANREYAIFKFNIKELLELIKRRNLPIKLEHDPITEITDRDKFLNRAHSIIDRISGRNYTKIRILLSDIASWVDGLEPKLEE